MDTAVNKSIADYIALIQQHFSDIESVYVFGSYAKGHSHADSDIDLAVVLKNLDDSKRFDVQVQLMLLASQVDTRIEPHPFSSDDLHADNPFLAEIKRTGFALFVST